MVLSFAMRYKTIECPSNDFLSALEYGLSFFPGLVYSTTKSKILEYGTIIMGIKIGVLSDTHLYRVSLELKEIYKKHLTDMDFVLHAGDVCSLDIVEFLEKHNFHGVSGNMDPLEVKAKLPDKKIVEIGPYKIGLIHGWGSPEGLEDRVFGEFTGVDVIVFGHSHRALCQKKEGVLLFNPGTATGPSLKDGHSIGILELTDQISGRIIRL